jgi:hypothetical protein
MRLRERALKRNGSAELIRHGEWHLDRALFARKNMLERGIPELISRVFRELLVAIDAFLHATHGVPESPLRHLAALIEAENQRVKSAKSGQKSTK